MRTLLLLVVLCVAGGTYVVWSVLPTLRAQFGSGPQPSPSQVSARGDARLPTVVPHEIDPAPPAQRIEQRDPVSQPETSIAIAPAATVAPATAPPGQTEVRWASPRSDEPDWSAELARQTRRVAERPDDLDARFELAALQMRLQLWTSAIDELDRIVQARPDDVRVRLNRAQALRAAGRVGEARGEWDRVIELDPQSIAARAYRGETLLDLGLWADAEPDFRAVLKYQPDDDVAVLNLALALRNLGRTPEALAEVEALLKLRPKHLAALKRAAGLAAEIAALPDPPPSASGSAIAYAKAALAIDERDAAMRSIVARWSER